MELQTKQANHGMTMCLWFDGQAKEAAEFYCSVFEDVRMLSVSDLVVEFEIEGVKMIGLNGGPHFQFNESFSIMVYCDDQVEVDRVWNSLVNNGGSESRCGWCKDKYGLSWQVIPTRFMEMMKKGSAEQTRRVMDAVMKMNKFIIEEIEMAFSGG